MRLDLLEQLALVCAGRPFYIDALRYLQIYIKTDLCRLDLPPAELVSRSPSQDPLESIMFLTSIGVPSVVYETVRDLRQSRGQRLGAMQRKFPFLGIVLLYILAILELTAAKLPSHVFGSVCRTALVRAQFGDSSGVRGAAWLWR